MAISSLDGLIAGTMPPVDFRKYRGGSFEAVGQMASLAYEIGWPGPAVAPTPGLAGAALTTYAGQIPFTSPAAGDSCYLSSFEADSTNAGTIFLYDRLWHNSAIVVTTTTAQTINSVAWPPRDQDGLTNGNGVVVAIEVSTATTNVGAIANTTMNYTNSAGVAGRTATIASFPVTAVAGTFVPFSLMTGDTGVRSIQSVTLGTSYGAGVVHLVAYRTLARIGLTVSNIGMAKDVATTAFPQLFDNTVPFVQWMPTVATGPTTFNGIVTYASG